MNEDYISFFGVGAENFDGLDADCSCGARWNFDAEGGSKIECPECGQTITIPGTLLFYPKDYAAENGDIGAVE
jgi:hypothetical protein